VDEFFSFPFGEVDVVEDDAVMLVAAEISESIASADEKRLSEVMERPLGLSCSSRSPDVAAVAEAVVK